MVRIGDKVRFLNDVGGGKVTGFANKNMVYVENEDGFEIPYPVSQLVVIGAEENGDYEKRRDAAKEPSKQEIVEKPVAPTGKIMEGKDSPDFYFCLVPDNSRNTVAGDIGMFLVNDSNFTLLYHFSYFRNDAYTTVRYGTIQPNSKIKLESLTEKDLSDLPEFGFQILFFREKGKQWYEPENKRFKINPVKFYREKSFQPNLFFEKNAMVLQITKNIQNTELDKLTDEDFKKIVKAKEVVPVAKQPEKKQVHEIVEVDLHIHELIENPSGLTNAEILEIQLDKVESEMNAAIRDRVKRIVFIHGVGQGILKNEITKLLKSKFKKYYFQDASFREYGYGATLVVLQKA